MTRYSRLSLCILLALAAGSCGDGQDSSIVDHTVDHGVDAPPAEQAMIDDRAAVHLSPEQERALGVVYTSVSAGRLTKTIRTVGQIVAPEPRLVEVTLKFDGYLERLFADFVGETVSRGDPLFTVYSPSLVAAQEELLTAVRLTRAVDDDSSDASEMARRTLYSARRRLNNWDITNEQIDSLEQSGSVQRSLTIHAPVGGVVLEKNALEGQRVMPGDLLYRIADLSTIWIEGEVFEQDLQFVNVGSTAHIEVSAYPGEHLMGRVSFVHPTVDTRSRTNRVRVEVRNRGLRLKPGMFATIFFDATLGRELPVIPLRAVVVTGERNLVFTRDSTGTLHPRSVVLGARAGDLVQVLEGISVGETVVGSANFLIDAESRLASGDNMPGMQHAGHGEAASPAVEDPEARRDHD